MEKTQRVTKKRISRLVIVIVIVQHEKFVSSLLYKQDGLDKAKKPIHASIPLSSENVFFSLLFFAGMILAGGVTSLCKQWIKLGGKL
jgi:hypothetical protein